MKSEKRAESKPKVTAVVLCAGCGARTGLAYNKLLHTVGVKTVLESTIDAVIEAGIESITLVISPDDERAVRELIKPYDGISICYGGKTRTQSAKNGLAFIEPCDIVVIHDGARPYAPPELIRAAVASAESFGSGIAALSAVDTIKEVSADGTVRTLDRDKLFAVQTPQAFRYGQIKAAYEKFDGVAYDDSQVYESGGYTPRLIEGSRANRKITTAEDLLPLPEDIKIGIGYDVHPLAENRALILGGVNIPHDKGLAGHSDADVLVHAVMDALLSAAALPDIGVLFPDTDPRFEGASSILLLKSVGERVREAGFAVTNISAVIAAQKPKLSPYIKRMRRNIADTLDMAVESVNISATTTERLGIVGEEKGMAANASCLIKTAETKRGRNK